MMMESAGEQAEKHNSIALPCSAVKTLVHKYESNNIYIYIYILEYHVCGGDGGYTHDHAKWDPESVVD